MPTTISPQAPPSTSNPAHALRSVARAAAACLGEFLAPLRDTFNGALRSDADVIIILARRAYIIFRIMSLAEELDLSSKHLNGQVMSQRAFERSGKLKAGRSYAVVDDTVVRGRTTKKYLPRIFDSNPACVELHALSICDKAKRELHELAPKDVDFSCHHLFSFDEDESIEFAQRAAEAIKASPFLYFVDFPVFVLAPTRMFCLSELIRALVADGWDVRAMPSKKERNSQDSGFVANYSLHSPDGLRLRINTVFDSNHELQFATLMPKITDVEPKEANDYREAERGLRDQLYMESLAAMEERFIRRYPGPIASLFPRPSLQDIRDHFPKDRWIEIESKLNGVARAEQERNDVAMTTYRLSTEGFDSLRSANVKPRFRKSIRSLLFKHIKVLTGEGMTETKMLELINNPNVTALQLREFLDVEHDASRLIPRIRHRALENGAYLPERRWTTGENLFREVVPDTEYKGPVLKGVICELPTLNGWVEFKKSSSVFTALTEAAYDGRIVAFLSDKSIQVPEELVPHDDILLNISSLVSSLPRSAWLPCDAHDWLASRRASFGNSSAYEYLKAGGDVEMISFELRNR